MDMLAQRKATGRLCGVLLVNGAPADESFISACAYVPQFDNFLPMMSCLETLQFYAGIVLPRTWSSSKRAARIEEVLQEMGLAHARLTLVGGESPGGLLLRGLRWGAGGGGRWQCGLRRG
jgi:ABC-type multidrug transport system ATPase subunit